MKAERNRTASAGVHTNTALLGRTLARALRTFPPRSVQGLRAFARQYWRLGLVLLGGVVQLVLTVMMWQLVDLSIALMEVWTELARKHLEIVLS